MVDELHNLSVKPDPDPTVLTTQALFREIASLKELFLSRISSMDEAVRLLQSKSDSRPTIGEITERFDEQIKGVNLRIVERDVIVDKTARETKTAVDAALSAQEKQAAAMSKTITEAIDKSERQVTKEVDSLKAALEQTRTNLDDKIQAAAKTLDDKIGDNRTRITAIETYGKGAKDIWGYIIGAVGAGMAIAHFFLRG